VRWEGATGWCKRRWPGGPDGAAQTALARRARRRGAAGACLGIGRLAPAAVAGTACVLEVVRHVVEARSGGAGMHPGGGLASMALGLSAKSRSGGVANSAGR
jgi:hypothetical protein